MNKPAFRRLWLGLFISYIGDQFSYIALPWFVLQLTGSGLAVSSVLFASTLPRIITGPIWGRLLDQMDPRKVMGWNAVARGLTVLALPVLHWTGHLTLEAVLVLSFLGSISAPSTDIGVRVTVPRLIGSGKNLEAANGLLAVALQAGVLIGPGLAGALVAATDAPTAMLIDAISFGLLALLLFTLPAQLKQTAEGSAHAAHTSFGAGLSYILRSATVSIITLLSFIFFTSYFPLEPSLPLYVKDTLHADADSFGLIWSVFGVGALLGLLLIPFLSRQPQPGRVLAVIAMLWGASLAPLFFLTQLPPVLVCFFFGGFFWSPYTTIEVSLLQRIIPSHMHGVVMGVRSSLLVSSGPIGVLVAGLLLNVLPPPSVIFISSLSCITAGLIGLILFSFKRNQLLQPQPEQVHG